MGADTANPGVTNTTGYMQAFAGSTGSNAIDDYAWYATNSESKTHPAGTKLSNELGLFDMSGNVMEWAWDWFGTYPTGTVTDSRGPASGSSRMYLGASWSYSADLCVLGNREYVDPYARAGNMGFRVVRP
jgi:formylglycine-generating enzyme required for sulfatase activity